jgi:hypothetical protein
VPHDSVRDLGPATEFGDSREPDIWSPRPGPTVGRLRENLHASGTLGEAAFGSILLSAEGVLSRAAPPVGDRARRTGLVVGQVQSGKTLSMTTVTALARDNGFRMVVVLGGVTNLLVGQTKDRFVEHLQPPGHGSYDVHWRFIDGSNPRRLQTEWPMLETLMASWRDPAIPDRRKESALCVVMKNHRHINELARLMASSDLLGLPVLLIDDEADQAGLNTVPSSDKGPSSTYRAIARLRASVPHHTYLQYTATPQAPLLISLIDMLSPEFAYVLDSGDEYTGGEAFFRTSERRLIRKIPSSELFTPGVPPASPPHSLQTSLQRFLVGVAGFAVEGRHGPWAMLVHPSQRRADHRVFLDWIRRLLSQWQRELRLPRAEPDRTSLEAAFEGSYRDLQGTDTAIPPFGPLLEELPLLIARTAITELNSEGGDEVNWDSAYAHVLVGGEKLNRGFTVKGLIETYMPRGPGGWNADTLQQRARFFGYKKKYIDRCRVALHPEVYDALEVYVDHERDVRDQLRRFHGANLSEWKRAFFLDSSLRPTRANVLRDPYFRLMSKRWFKQVAPHDDAVRFDNANTISSVVEVIPWTPYWRDGRHASAIMQGALVLKKLLVPLKVITASETRWLYATRVWLDYLLRRNPNEDVRLILMDGGREEPDARVRMRTADAGVVELHQGRDPGTKHSYPGDAKVYDSNRVTVQVHTLRVASGGESTHGVYAIAVRFPMEIPNVLIQDQTL